MHPESAAAAKIESGLPARHWGWWRAHQVVPTLCTQERQRDQNASQRRIYLTVRRRPLLDFASPREVAPCAHDVARSRAISEWNDSNRVVHLDARAARPSRSHKNACYAKCMEMPSSMPDSDLLATLPALLTRERAMLVEVIAYLAEIDRRRLYLEQACSSLRSFCIERLGYSEDEASKRVRVVRLARRLPRVLDELQNGGVHLTGLFLLAPYLTEENAESLHNAQSARKVFGEEHIEKKRHERAERSCSHRTPARPPWRSSLWRPRRHGGDCR